MKLLYRCNSYGGIRFDAIPVRLIEIDSMGHLEEKHVTIDDLAKDVRNEEKLSLEKSNGIPQPCNYKRSRMRIRDLKIFSPFHSMSLLDEPCAHVKVIETKKHPSIMVRPSAKCFLLELEHIKLLCKNDRCIIFHPEQNADEIKAHTIIAPRSVVSFINSFILDLKTSVIQGKESASSFEIIVLEVVFSNVASKLMNNLSVIKPVLEALMHEILSSNPPTQQMLRKILALKQNIAKFKNDVQAMETVIQNILSNDKEMADLRLTFLDQVGQIDVTEHEDVELLLEAFNAYLSHIMFELKRMDADIGDVEDFVTIHLSSARNKILKLSLFMEIGMLSVAFGAMLAGIFGMNLGFGDDEWKLSKNHTGFYIGFSIILLITFFLTALCYVYYKALNKDTRQAQKSNFHALKNFTLVIDEVISRLNDKAVGKDIISPTKTELTNVLNDVVFAQADEQEIIFKSVHMH